MFIYFQIYIKEELESLPRKAKEILDKWQQRPKELSGNIFTNSWKKGGMVPKCTSNSSTTQVPKSTIRLQCYINLPQAASLAILPRPSACSHLTLTQHLNSECLWEKWGEGNFLNKNPQLLWLNLQMLGKVVKKSWNMQLKKPLLASTLSEKAIPINDDFVLMQAVSCTTESKKRVIFWNWIASKTNQPYEDDFVICRIWLKYVKPVSSVFSCQFRKQLMKTLSKKKKF